MQIQVLHGAVSHLTSSTPLKASQTPPDSDTSEANPTQADSAATPNAVSLHSGGESEVGADSGATWASDQYGGYRTYFVLCEATNSVKIGRSFDPYRRFNALTTASPHPLRLLGFVRANIEQELHQQFAAFRRNGEWFEYVDEVKDVIAGMLTSFLPRKVPIYLRQERELFDADPFDPPRSQDESDWFNWVSYPLAALSIRLEQAVRDGLITIPAEFLPYGPRQMNARKWWRLWRKYPLRDLDFAAMEERYPATDAEMMALRSNIVAGLSELRPLSPTASEAK